MMTKEKLTEQQAQGQKCIARAREIYAAAEAADRDMSPTELGRLQRRSGGRRRLAQTVREAKNDLAVIDKAREIGEAIGYPLNGARWLAAWAAWPARTAG